MPQRWRRRRNYDLSDCRRWRGRGDDHRRRRACRLGWAGGSCGNLPVTFGPTLGRRIPSAFHPVRARLRRRHPRAGNPDPLVVGPGVMSRHPDVIWARRDNDDLGDARRWRAVNDHGGRHPNRYSNTDVSGRTGGNRTATDEAEKGKEFEIHGSLGFAAGDDSGGKRVTMTASEMEYCWRNDRVNRVLFQSPPGMQHSRFQFRRIRIQLRHSSPQLPSSTPATG